MASASASEGSGFEGEQIRGFWPARIRKYPDPIRVEFDKIIKRAGVVALPWYSAPL